jgi:hypothetical protein
MYSSGGFMLKHVHDNICLYERAFFLLPLSPSLLLTSRCLACAYSCACACVPVPAYAVVGASLPPPAALALVEPSSSPSS